ncbi:MAG TPA: hypothetical protein VGT24_01705 [Candidatus Acidoferrales bacterium]|nr:hypothetical protein [Candidatus Acidoferrales bacterium]
MSIVKKLEQEVTALDIRLRVARERLYEERLKEFGLVPGETVLVSKDGKDYLFVAAKYFAGDPCWVDGHPRKKDGSWSSQVRTLYRGWRIKPSVAEAR